MKLNQMKIFKYLSIGLIALLFTSACKDDPVQDFSENLDNTTDELKMDIEKLENELTSIQEALQNKVDSLDMQTDQVAEDLKKDLEERKKMMEELAGQLNEKYLKLKDVTSDTWTSIENDIRKLMNKIKSELDE